MSEPTPAVLVVDDERFFREAICDALREAGFACRAVSGAEEAFAAASDPALGVVVLDLRLPGGSGLDVLRRLQATRPGLRVIVVATHAEQEDVLEALRLDASDYLAKPLHDEELVLAVRRAARAFALESRLASLREGLRALDAKQATLAAAAAPAAADAAALDSAIAAALAELLGASKASLLRRDAEGRALHVCAAVGAGVEPERVAEAALCEGTTGRLLGGGAAVAAPIPGPDGPLGVLCAGAREGGARFGEDDLVLLRLFARQAGALLAPAARPAPEPEAPAAGAVDADAELARAVCDALAMEVEPQRLVEAALRPIARALPAAPVSLYLIDNASGELRLEGQQDLAGRGDRKSLPRQRGLTALVLQTGRVVASDRPQADPRFDPDVDTPENGVAGPLLCVPLRWRNQVLGVARAFPQGGAPASARTGEVLSAVLSAAVRNVFLYRSLLESIEDLAEARREAQGRSEA